MTVITITREQLLALNPCESRRDAALSSIGWSAGAVDAAAARAAGVLFGDVVWVASALAQSNADIGRRLSLFAADGAAHVLYLYEEGPSATRVPREAIIAARQFARGEITDAARAAAWAAARDAARDAASDAASDAAWAAAWAAAWDAASDAASDAAWAAASDAARAAAWAAARDAAWAAEEKWQFGRLVAWLSDNEPDDWPLPPLPNHIKAE